MKDTIADLREFPSEMVVERLKAAFDSAQTGQKLSLAYALADYGQGDLEFLVSAIADAPSAECPNFVDALDHNREVALDRLSELARADDGSQDWTLKGRLAVLALHLGDAAPAINVHADRPDPIQQTVFIHDVFSTWHADLKELAEVIDAAENARLRAGMCLAMGNLSAEQFADAQATWQVLLRSWYLQSPDSGTHSAAAWALRQRDVDLPEIAADATEPKDRDWKVTPMGREHGFTMVRIPAGQFQRTYGKTEQAVTLTRDLWLSDVEVTVGLFQQFMDDESHPGLKPKDWPGVDARKSPTDQHPAQQVRTTTYWGFGSDVERLKHYAVFTSKKAESAASKLSNRWGLFDIHGNVWGPFEDSPELRFAAIELLLLWKRVNVKRRHMGPG